MLLFSLTVLLLLFCINVLEYLSRKNNLLTLINQGLFHASYLLRVVQNTTQREIKPRVWARKTHVLNYMLGSSNTLPH